MCQNAVANNKYIRNVLMAPEKIISLMTDRQLNDIVRFCTKPHAISILGIDPTYNLGPCYVTITTYRHLLFSTEDGVLPVMLGTALIHTKNEYSSYFQLPSEMLRLEPKVKNITVFGRDIEKNVYQPFEDLSPSAHHLLCELHMKDNTWAKLTKANLNTSQVDAVMKDIFDRKIGEVVHSLNAEHYDKMAEELFVKWNKNYVDSTKDFLLYFKSKKSQLIKNRLVGLGYPPKPYTQNANECVNGVLKRGQRKCKSITDVIKILQDYVKEQDTQIQLSLMGQGEWQLLIGDWNISEIEFYSKHTHKGPHS